MLAFLKDHPFAVEAWFEQSLVLSFAIPKAEAEALLPPCLVPDCYNSEWAFVTAAIVQTKQLRPKGFPKFMGNDFFLIGYRIFVRYKNNAGKNLRGLYILKSETNKKKMEWLGNIFTHYNYSTTDIQCTLSGNQQQIQSRHSGFDVHIQTGNTNIGLPQHSPFPDWAAARRFAGPLPFTFTWDEKNKEVLIIEGVRENWVPEPVKVLHHEFAFLQEMGFSNSILANAFRIRNIPYWWKKGRKEKWNPTNG